MSVRAAINKQRAHVTTVRIGRRDFDVDMIATVVVEDFRDFLWPEQN